jgi:hypothetical protein
MHTSAPFSCQRLTTAQQSLITAQNPKPWPATLKEDNTRAACGPPLTVACSLDRVSCVKAVWWEGPDTHHTDTPSVPPPSAPLLTVAGSLDRVSCVKAVWWEGHLTEVAAHHLSQWGHTQACVVVGGPVHLVLVDGDA